MQYERGAGTSKDSYPILGDLPAKNIDTGLGLERTAAILQGVENIYEIDTTAMVLKRATELTGVRYGADHASDVMLRVIADHARTAAMLIGDGVTPGNEGRGYVLRRMMRRTTRNMRLLGAHDPTMRELIRSSIAAMGPQYPELIADQKRIETISVSEEESFLQTLRSGTQIFDVAATNLKKSGSTKLSGEEVFKLHDTYGFPFDLTLEMASEQGLSIDESGFRRLMKAQRERAKADSRAKKTGHADLSVYRTFLDSVGRVEFLGYEQLEAESLVGGLLVDGKSAKTAVSGDEVEIVLGRTPFYAEGGGQLSDSGLIVTSDGATIEIDDVQSPVNGLIVHRGRVIEGQVGIGAPAHALVDMERRRAISRAHTATHLVHKAFREALGETATQAGSENAPGRFRFDFAATGAISPIVLVDVEARVNEILADDLGVSSEIMTQAQAKAIGAMALFGEKYGEQVRVVSVGDWSRELCGGTHATRSGQLGVVKLLGESSIGAGVRRVEALVGVDAYQFLAREHTLLNSLTEIIKGARADELPERISALVGKLRDVERELAAIHGKEILAAAPGLAETAQEINGFAFISDTVPPGTSADDVRRLVLDVANRIKDRPVVVALATINDDKPLVIVAVDEKARTRGAKAGALVRVAAGILGGGGGGKDDLAQGGGTDPSKIEEALLGLAKSLNDLA
jgi:alanyl-tRNA synthetase